MTLDDPRREPAPAPRDPEPDAAPHPDPAEVTATDSPQPGDPGVAGLPPGASGAWSNDPDGTEQAPKPKIRIRQRGQHLGLVACILAAILFVVNVVGIVLSNSGDESTSLNLAYITIFGTILTFLGGFLAAMLNLGRVWGTAAVVLSVLANPFVLVVLLSTFTGAVR